MKRLFAFICFLGCVVSLPATSADPSQERGIPFPEALDRADISKEWLY